MFKTITGKKSKCWRNFDKKGIMYLRSAPVPIYSYFSFCFFETFFSKSRNYYSCSFSFHFRPHWQDNNMKMSLRKSASIPRKSSIRGHQISLKYSNPFSRYLSFFARAICFNDIRRFSRCWESSCFQSKSWRKLKWANFSYRRLCFHLFC